MTILLSIISALQGIPLADRVSLTVVRKHFRPKE